MNVSDGTNYADFFIFDGCFLTLNNVTIIANRYAKQMDGDRNHNITRTGNSTRRFA